MFGLPHLGVGPGVHLVDRDEQQRHRRQDRPDDFQRVAAVRELHRLAVRAGVVLPHELEQRHFGGDEHDARQPEDEHEQLVDHAAVLGDVLAETRCCSTAQRRTSATPSIGTIRNTMAQKRIHNESPRSIRLRMSDCGSADLHHDPRSDIRNPQLINSPHPTFTGRVCGRLAGSNGSDWT